MKKIKLTTRVKLDINRALAYGRLTGTALSLALLMTFSLAGGAFADTSSSAHYKVSETQFGAGSDLQECSGNYCAKTSAGDLTVGNTKSTNYMAWAGFNTVDQPQLEIIAVGGTQDMGVLKTTTTGTAVFGVNVRNYLSKGYVIQITGSSLGMTSHNLASPSSPTASNPGAEQFGINLTANTTPNIGAAPVQVPSSVFSFGTVASNYSQTNKFMYQDGDVVAQSLSSSGETDYTVSMIANIAPSTPAGRYNGNFSAVAVPVY